MWTLTEEKFQKKLKKIQEINLSKERRVALKNEQNKFSKNQSIETNKIIAIYLFVLLNAIVIYSMVAMWHLQDLTYLGVLITDIAAQVLTYAIYCLKAYHGKKQEELIKLERDQLFNGDLETDEIYEDTVG